MSSRTLIIKRFALGPLAQWGFVAGIVIACLPAFVCSWVFFALVGSLQSLISGWQDVGFEILGQRLSLDLVELLQLEDALRALTGLTGLGIFGILLLALAAAALLGAFGALVLTCIGLFYNATGRLKLEVEEEDRGGQSAGIGD
jgi:hypothetical protein